MPNDDVRHAMEQAIRIAGSERKLGRLTGFSQNAIWHAKREGRVSGRLALAIEQATEGRVGKAILCPDLFGWHAATEDIGKGRDGGDLGIQAEDSE